MMSFEEIEERAYARHGGAALLEPRLLEPSSKAELLSISDDRWLSAFSKIVFQTGFNWSVIENKWPAFEENFAGFNLKYCAALSDEMLEEKMQTGKIVKHWAKCCSIRDNAIFLHDLAIESGSVGAYFSEWQAVDFARNIQMLKKRGSRLGGRVGQIALRRMGVDVLVLSADVVGALAQAGSINKMPSSQRAWAQLQETIDCWQDESAYSLNRISQLLGYSYGDIY
jgi:3-methyladenine DNA glycosylase Tag